LFIDSNGDYHYILHGPNGFYREFKSNTKYNNVNVNVSYKHKNHNKLRIYMNKSDDNITFVLKDNSYNYTGGN